MVDLYIGKVKPLPVNLYEAESYAPMLRLEPNSAELELSNNIH
jgi:hypothetical protein